MVKLTKRQVKRAFKDRIILAITIAFSVLALQGILELFPSNITTLWKIIIGLGGGVLAVIYGEPLLKKAGL